MCVLWLEMIMLVIIFYAAFCSLCYNVCVDNLYDGRVCSFMCLEWFKSGILEHAVLSREALIIRDCVLSLSFSSGLGLNVMT